MEKLNMLKHAKHIWIYGAGCVGQYVNEILRNEALQLPVRGFVVTKKETAEEGLDDALYEIGELTTPDKESVFVIAVSLKYQEAIIEQLLKHGYSRYIIWQPEYEWDIWRVIDYQFENRSRGFTRACFILSGYKEFLWKDVFGRLKRFAPEDVDICILSSGMRSEKLADLAQKNGWSYLSTKLNDVSLIQNLAFALFREAEWVYKMDEDIFLTDGCFDRMMRQAVQVEKTEPYHIGFVVPLINVNGYSYLRILERIQKTDVYESRFGKAFYGADASAAIEKEAQAAQFMWGQDACVPQLDDLNEQFKKYEEYSICGMRFSIGFILIRRQVWKNMRCFTASGKIDMGSDERELCQYCCLRSLAVIAAENTVVGHFSFGGQTSEMKKFYERNPELFRIKNKSE